MEIEVFGITGTNGKTTVSYMLKSILEEAGRKCGLIGTISHEIGGNNYEAINTTPSRELLKKYFHEMQEQNIETCVMEISSHGLEQGRVDNVNIHYSGFTNLSQDHLDYHITMEKYFEAKSKLFFMTQKGMCINIDNSYGKRLYEKMKEEQSYGHLKPGIKIQTVSLEESNSDVYGTIEENSINGIKIKMNVEGENWEDIRIEMPGKTTAYNAMTAVTMCKQAGIDRNSIINGLQKLRGVPGRFQRVDNNVGIDIVVDFAHTPDALENLLKLAREIGKGRLICVFGCGGNRDREKRSIMGRIAEEYSDFFIITSDNPRFENPKDIIKDIEQGLREHKHKYTIEVNRYEAIKKAIDMYKKDDLIVIAGRGHEKYQKVNGEQLPFDDRQVAKDIIDMRE